MMLIRRHRAADQASDGPHSPPGLRPILEDKMRRRSSLQALADLASVGLCSTSVAARASQFALNAQMSEDFHVPYDPAWPYDPTEPFNPYAAAEFAPSAASLRDSVYEALGALQQQPAPRDDEAPQSGEAAGEGPATGFSVVSGYLDRSEDAMRRWTLAMADVPDDVLVHHLERLRKESQALSRGRLPGRRSAAPSQVGHAGAGGDEEEPAAAAAVSPDRRASFFFGGPREMGISSSRSPRSPAASRARFSVGHYDPSYEGDEIEDDSDEDGLSDADEDDCGGAERDDADAEEEEKEWKTARHVLFSCRELVQTERAYHARLRELERAGAEVLAPKYASLVARCVPALRAASARLLAHVEDDPSAWGVSAAFIGCEDELEAACVAWAGVVGEFFADGAALLPPRKLSKRPASTTMVGAWGTDDALSSGHGHDFSRSHGSISASAVVGGARRFSTTMSDIGHHGSHGGGEAYLSASSRRHSSAAGMFTAALGTGLAFGLAPVHQPHRQQQQLLTGTFPFESEPCTTSAARPRKAHSVQGHGHGHGGVSLTRVSTASSALSLSRSWKPWRRFSLSSLSLARSPPPPPFPSPPPALLPPTPMSTSFVRTGGGGSVLGHGHGHGHTSPVSPRKLSEQDVKMNVRDLAIQPVQRVMRYVLKYRGASCRSRT